MEPGEPGAGPLYVAEVGVGARAQKLVYKGLK